MSLVYIGDLHSMTTSSPRTGVVFIFTEHTKNKPCESQIGYFTYLVISDIWMAQIGALWQQQLPPTNTLCKSKENIFFKWFIIMSISPNLWFYFPKNWIHAALHNPKHLQRCHLTVLFKIIEKLLIKEHVWCNDVQISSLSIAICHLHKVRFFLLWAAVAESGHQGLVSLWSVRWYHLLSLRQLRKCTIFCL